MVSSCKKCRLAPEVVPVVHGSRRVGQSDSAKAWAVKFYYFGERYVQITVGRGFELARSSTTAAFEAETKYSVDDG